MGIDADAPVTLAAEVLVDAPAAVVWDVLADVRAWPTWHPGIRSVVADRDPGPQTTFRWKPGPYRIDSTIQEFDPQHRIGWTGRSPGIAARHVWTVRPDDGGGALVHTDESLTGPLPRLLRRQLSNRVQRDLDNWLGHLKVQAERRSRT